MISEGEIKELNIILKADVQGSVEAVSQSLEKLSTDEVRVKHPAQRRRRHQRERRATSPWRSDAIIVGFNVRPSRRGASWPSSEGVEIKLYRIIYELLDDVKKAMVGMLDPKSSEKMLGRAEVRADLQSREVGTIAGCYVRRRRDQRATRRCALVRDGIVVYEGKLASLRRFKDDVSEVTPGLRVRHRFENFNDVKEGDIIEAYTMEQVAQTLDSTD